MTGATGRFWIEDGAFGVRLIAKTANLTSDCLGPDEIEANISALKADLDDMGEEMKRIDALRSKDIL